MLFWDEGFEINSWPGTSTHVQEKNHNYVERRWAQSGWSFHPSESSRPTGFHSKWIMPIEPCVSTASLGDERCCWISNWEEPTRIPRGLDDRQPELFVPRYVYTIPNAVPSNGLYIWMKSMISIFSLMATTLINLLS